MTPPLGVPFIGYAGEIGRHPTDQKVADRHPNIPQHALIAAHYVSVRDGIVADVTEREDGSPSITCQGCGAALVDDGRGPFYDAAADSGLPHRCGDVLL